MTSRPLTSDMQIFRTAHPRVSQDQLAFSPDFALHLLISCRFWGSICYKEIRLHEQNQLSRWQLEMKRIIYLWFHIFKNEQLSLLRFLMMIIEVVVMGWEVTKEGISHFMTHDLEPSWLCHMVKLKSVTEMRGQNSLWRRQSWLGEAEVQERSWRQLCW